jgi:hypothetical protein
VERDPDPDLTLWEYDSGSAEDDVDEFEAELERVYEGTVD